MSWLSRARRAALLLSVPLMLLSAGAGAAPAPLPYDEHAQPAAELQSALERARSEHKNVLIVFGANWCEDCRALERAFKTEPTAAMLAPHYEIIKVDIGQFDKNLDFVHRYGNPISKGIPSVVVVTPSNTVVYQTRAGELADARHLGNDGIGKFFSDLNQRVASARP